MRVEQAFVGARVVDSYPGSGWLTAAQAARLKCTGIDGFVGYLGVMSRDRLAAVLDAGLSYMPVTVAGEYEDGAADELAQLKALGIPAGCTVWLDVEGPKAHAQGAGIIPKIDRWAADIASAGYQPGVYFAPPQPLTSDEMWRLKTVRYWKGMGSIRDRNGALAEPTGCGWCMTQLWHGSVDEPKGGQWWPDAKDPAKVFVDVNAVSRDFRTRLPNWVRG